MRREGARQGQPAVWPGFSSWLCPQVPLADASAPACTSCCGVHPVIGDRAACGGCNSSRTHAVPGLQGHCACATLPPCVVFPSERKW